MEQNSAGTKQPQCARITFMATVLRIVDLPGHGYVCICLKLSIRLRIKLRINIVISTQVPNVSSPEQFGPVISTGGICRSRDEPLLIRIDGKMQRHDHLEWICGCMFCLIKYPATSFHLAEQLYGQTSRNSVTNLTKPPQTKITACTKIDIPGDKGRVVDLLHGLDDRVPTTFDY